MQLANLQFKLISGTVGYMARISEKCINKFQYKITFSKPVKNKKFAFIALDTPYLLRFGENRLFIYQPSQDRLFLPVFSEMGRVLLYLGFGLTPLELVLGFLQKNENDEAPLYLLFTFFLIFILIILGVTGHFLKINRRRKHLTQLGKKITGSVISWKEEKDSEGDIYYSVIVEYFLPDSSFFTLKLNNIEEKPVLGKKFPLLYDPQFPEFAMLYTGKEGYTGVGCGQVLLFVLFVISIIGFIIFIVPLLH
jgi:hypothetical protein